MASREGKPIMEMNIDLTVTRAEFGEVLPPETFELEFPVGTRVEDRILEIEYTVGKITSPAESIDEWIENVVTRVDESPAAELGNDKETEEVEAEELQDDISRGARSLSPLVYVAAAAALLAIAWTAILIRRRK